MPDGCPGPVTPSLAHLPSPLAQLQVLDIANQMVETILTVTRELLEGVQYGPVPSAPADVPVQDVVDLLLGGVRVLLEVAVELHHHARRAVSALSPAICRQTLLYGMISLGLAPQSLYCGDLPPITDVDRSQAGVERPRPPSLRLPHRHDAGPAAALTAGDLGPGQQRHLPDIRGQAGLGGVCSTR